MGQALRGGAGGGGARGRATAQLAGTRALRAAFAAALLLGLAPAGAQEPQLPAGAAQLDSARFTVIAFPGDLPLARSLLAYAVATDTFPGLPRGRTRVTVAVAPDERRFRDWIGPAAPEWGAAVAMPEARRIVMQGRRAGSSAGDPRVTLRHELAHLALHEALGDLPPRWFDEGYASFVAGEWGRDELLATNLALVLRGAPSLGALDRLFEGGESRAQQGYALAHRAVAELAALDPERGLTLFFAYWRETRAFDQAVRRAYGMTEAAFETRWKSATRRRYGALALVADVTLGALAMLLLVGPLWVIRRDRDRRRLAALLAADATQERREQDSALEALLSGEPAGGAPGESGGDGGDGGDAGSRRAENDDQIK